MVFMIHDVFKINAVRHDNLFFLYLAFLWWWSIVVKNLDCGDRLPRFKSWLLNSLPCNLEQVSQSLCYVFKESTLWLFDSFLL